MGHVTQGSQRSSSWLNIPERCVRLGIAEEAAEGKPGFGQIEPDPQECNIISFLQNVHKKEHFFASVVSFGATWIRPCWKQNSQVPVTRACSAV